MNDKNGENYLQESSGDKSRRDLVTDDMLERQKNDFLAEIDALIREFYHTEWELAFDELEQMIDQALQIYEGLAENKKARRTIMNAKIELENIRGEIQNWRFYFDKLISSTIDSYKQGCINNPGIGYANNVGKSYFFSKLRQSFHTSYENHIRRILEADPSQLQTLKIYIKTRNMIISNGLRNN